MGGGPSREVDGQRGGTLQEARRSVDSQAGVGSGVVLVAATEILRIAGLAAYHTSVILGDKEYYFDSQGIISAPALWSHFVGQSKRPQEFKTEVINCGSGLHSGFQLVQSLQSFFDKGSYDVLHKNCNVFTDAALYYLTRRRLDGRFSRLERWLVATEPFSTEVLNRLLMVDPPKDPPAAPAGGSAGRLWPGPYLVNPRAEHFSVDHVIAACDVLNASEAGGRLAERSVCGCVLDGWNCVNADTAEDVPSNREDGPEAAVSIQACRDEELEAEQEDEVQIPSKVGTRKCLVPTQQESPMVGKSISREEELRYWDFELGDEENCAEAEYMTVPSRTLSLHEIVGEAWAVELSEQDASGPKAHPPRRCPTWSSQPLPRRGNSLDGSLDLPALEELAQCAEALRGPEGLRRPAERRRRKASAP